MKYDERARAGFRPSVLSGTPAEEYQQTADDDGANTGDSGDIDVVLLSDRGCDRSYIDHLPIRRVGEPPEHQRRNANGDQYQSCY